MLRPHTKTNVQVDGMAANNLFITKPGLPQAASTACGSGITVGFIRCLYHNNALLCAHILSGYNGLVIGFIPTMHSPNKDHSKGE